MAHPQENSHIIQKFILRFISPLCMSYMVLQREKFHMSSYKENHLFKIFIQLWL